MTDKEIIKQKNEIIEQQKQVIEYQASLLEVFKSLQNGMVTEISNIAVPANGGQALPTEVHSTIPKYG